MHVRGNKAYAKGKPRQHKETKKEGGESHGIIFGRRVVDQMLSFRELNPSSASHLGRNALPRALLHLLPLLVPLFLASLKGLPTCTGSDHLFFVLQPANNGTYHFLNIFSHFLVLLASSFRCFSAFLFSFLLSCVRGSTRVDGGPRSGSLLMIHPYSFTFRLALSSSLTARHGSVPSTEGEQAINRMVVTVLRLLVELGNSGSLYAQQIGYLLSKGRKIIVS